MNEVRRVIRLASWRLWFVDVIRTFMVTATAALALVLLARIVEKVLGLTPQFDQWWKTAWLGVGGAVLATSILWAIIRRRRTLSVAVELDERAGLRESLSTALCVEKSQDPWANAMIESAQAKAKNVNVSRAIPMQAPSFWPVPLATGLALLLVWVFMPNFDLLGTTKKQVAEEKKRDEVVAVKADVATKEQQLKKMLDQAKVQFTDEKADAAAEERKPEANDPEAIRRSAVKKLTDLAQKLENAKNGEKEAQADAIKEAMKQLKQPGPGPLDEFTKALARGDFNKAQEQMAEISKQMANGSKTPEEMAAAKAQMENLAKQLDKMSKNSDQLQKKLEQAGLDKKAAAEMIKKALANPEDMKKALDEAKNLSPDQKKQLLEMAKAASQCQGECQKMGAGMGKMAQGMSQSGLQQEGQEGMAELSKALSEAEMLQETCRTWTPRSARPRSNSRTWASAWVAIVTAIATATAGTAGAAPSGRAARTARAAARAPVARAAAARTTWARPATSPRRRKRPRSRPAMAPSSGRGWSTASRSRATASPSSTRRWKRGSRKPRKKSRASRSPASTTTR